MPTSNWQNISYDIEIIRLINPQNILDAGMGFGRWGILSREFLEVWDDDNIHGKWKRTIDAIEIYKPYIKDYHRYFYSNIYNEDMLNFFYSNTKKYDLIIFGDVIEHLEKNEAINIIRKALLMSDYIIINIPIGKFWEQDALDDNINQAHKSIWNTGDFRKLGFTKIKVFRDYQLRKFAVIVLSGQRISLRKLYKSKYGKHFFIKNFIKHYLGFRNLVIKYLAKK